MLTDQLITGLILGVVYALIAIGYSLIFETIRLLHFSQGELLMVGAFMGWSFIGVSSNPVLVMFLVFVALLVFGIVMERLFYRPIPHHMFTQRIIATLGISVALRSLATVVWSPRAVSLPDKFFTGAPVKLGSIVIQPSYYWTFATAIVLMVLLGLFLTKTKAGLAMRTAAFNPEIAELMGINASLMKSVSFGIAAGITGVGGLLVAPITFIHFEMGIGLGMKGFAAAILGGLGNITGAVVGGIMLGLIETFGATWISSGYKDVIAFVVLILILVIKPSGILGRVTLDKI